MQRALRASGRGRFGLGCRRVGRGCRRFGLGRGRFGGGCSGRFGLGCRRSLGGFGSRLWPTRRPVVIATVATGTATGAVAACHQVDGWRRIDHRGAGIYLVEPEAKDAVGDLQVVVEIVEYPWSLLEAEEAVVGLISPLDLVSHLSQAPRPLLLEGRTGLDALARVDRYRFTTLVGSLWVEHQHEFIFGS